MPLDATDFGYVSIPRDEPSPGDSTNIKVGGYCIVGTSGSTMNPGDALIVSTAADDTYLTTTSANATGIAGFVVASLPRGMQWDYDSAIASGVKILVVIKGVVRGTASAAITRGDRVGTSTTAGQVATTSTQDGRLGRALQAATAQGDRLRILVG